MVKNSPANIEDVGLITGLGRSPGEGNGNPLQYSCLENPMEGCFEIDDSQFSSAAAASVSDSDLTLRVAARVILLGDDQRLLRRALRDLCEIRTRHVSSGRGIRSILLDSHIFSPYRRKLQRRALLSRKGFSV